MPGNCAPIGVNTLMTPQPCCRDGGLSGQLGVKSTPVTDPMNRLFALLITLSLCACSWTGERFEHRAGGDPSGAAVEVFVKSNHDGLISDIRSGDGPFLDDALALANVPLADRPARALQLRGNVDLYAVSPSALVSTLLLYGG